MMRRVEQAIVIYGIAVLVWMFLQMTHYVG